ncbi:MAG: type 1 glutamine amidotransferase [Rhodobacteraceae bacterium]|nr:type 1 glutamine amidotransferase [Paracoccaceae bacterium]
MKIGILETGKPAESLIPDFGDYPAMFEKLLGDLLSEASFFAVSVVHGEMPTAPDQADVWIITGSRHSAYEDLPWVDVLKEFLRQCMARKVPIVGICFGHQILAEAMGGKVEKSTKGWGVGVQDYAVENT